METKFKYNQENSGHKDSFQKGLEFQDFVCDKLLEQLGIPLVNYSSKKYQYIKGENYQGIEIKLDRRCTETGRLSIETAEKTNKNNPNFVPSGIYRKDGTWLYVQGNEKKLFVFSKKLLQQLHRSGRFQNKQEPTLESFYLPLPDAEKYCCISLDLQ